MGHRRKQADDISSDSSISDSIVSPSSDSSSDVRKRRRKKRRGEKKIISSSENESDASSSDDDSRKTKRKRRHRRDRETRREKSDRRKKDRKHKKVKDEKRTRKHHEADDEEHSLKDEHALKKGTQAKLQVTMEAREQEKYLIYQNAEIAKARLNGELKQAQNEQAKMQDMYGAIDWRARKKLRLEKKKLERSVAAGKKLAQMEEEEVARMDAFRVALGLPTAEAQRQAEWRAEATRALAQEPQQHSVVSKPPKKTIIGPRLPRF